MDKGWRRWGILVTSEWVRERGVQRRFAPIIVVVVVMFGHVELNEERQRILGLSLSCSTSSLITHTDIPLFSLALALSRLIALHNTPQIRFYLMILSCNEDTKRRHSSFVQIYKALRNLQRSLSLTLAVLTMLGSGYLCLFGSHHWANIASPLIPGYCVT